MISNARSTIVSTQNSARLDAAKLLPEYMFANTPAYLFERMRALPPVRELGEKADSQELVQLIEQIDLGKKTPTSVALAYAYTTALSFRPQSEVTKALEGKKFESLAWFGALLALGFAASKNASPTIVTIDQGLPLPERVAAPPSPARNSVIIDLTRRE